MLYWNKILTVILVNFSKKGVEIMAVCTFFGHHDCPVSVRSRLKDTLTELIERQGVDRFYVGYQGSFDRMAAGLLAELKSTFPKLEAYIVLAYLTTEPNEAIFPLPTLYPEGLETVPKRFAISRRNLWMLRHADYVITYINHGWGGAAQFAEKAHRQGKIIYPLGQYPPVP